MIQVGQDLVWDNMISKMIISYDINLKLRSSSKAWGTQYVLLQHESLTVCAFFEGVMFPTKLQPYIN